MKLPFSLGAVLLAVVLVALAFGPRLLGPTTPRAADAPQGAEAGGALAARLDAIEERLARLESAGRSGEPARGMTGADAGRGAPSERLLVGLLHLQSVAALALPWPRELQLVLHLVGPGQLASPLTEVLAAHAARGVPTRDQLRERFAALQPELLAHAPVEASVTQRLLQGGRAAVASLGVVDPPPPGRTEAALAGMSEHLARGDLSGALHDAGTLHPRLQPRIAEWSAQTRDRLAVDQAVRELVLQSLRVDGRRP